MGRPQATIRSIHSCRESKGKESGQVKDQSIYRTRHMQRGSALLDPTHAEVPTAALPARTPILSTRLKPQFPRQAGGPAFRAEQLWMTIPWPGVMNPLFIKFSFAPVRLFSILLPKISDSGT